MSGRGRGRKKGVPRITGSSSTLQEQVGALQKEIAHLKQLLEERDATIRVLVEGKTHVDGKLEVPEELIQQIMQQEVSGSVECFRHPCLMMLPEYGG
jgi:hypothetical protein